MATYKEIFGQKINKLSSDPSNALTGEMWYNSASGTLRGLGIVEAWSSASPLSTARQQMAGAGIQTAALGFGGNAPPYTNKTEEYNGTGWATGGNLNTARFGAAGFGIQTNAVAAGGYSGTDSGPGQNQTEEYNGTAWTSGNNMGTGRRQLAGAGVETAGLVFGGRVSDPTFSNASEEYDGTNWTAGGTMNTPAPSSTALAGCGTQTAGLRFGGSPSVTANTETYDGTSWTEVNDMNTGRGELGGNGNQTSALAYGGGPPTTAKAESWNGTSWTEGPDLATARINIAGAGASNSAAVAFGGGPPASTATEEFTSSTNAITAAAWASGGSLNQGRINVSMGGTQTAGIVLGGHQSPGAEPAAVETYNGSAFTSGTAIGPYTGDYAAYAGSQTQGIIFGGAPYTTNTAEYDGEWAAGGSLSQGRSDLMGAGTGETSAVAIGGFSPAPTARAETEEYGGTSWTSGGSLSTGRGQGAGFGIETAALITGGEVSGGTKQSATEEYNGSSWTSGGSLITATGDYIGGWGTQTSGVVVGGATTDYVTTTLEYDGTSFTTRPNAANPAGRTQTAGANSAAGLRAGGGPNTTQRDGSEEFTGETSTANVETFSTS
jgi:hypothetical protein